MPPYPSPSCDLFALPGPAAMALERCLGYADLAALRLVNKQALAFADEHAGGIYVSCGRVCDHFKGSVGVGFDTASIGWSTSRRWPVRTSTLVASM